MPLLRLTEASLNYGTHILLDRVELAIRNGARIGLLGRNGAGKSTLLKVILGEIALESGERWLRGGVKLAYLGQDLPEADEHDVYDVVAHGLAGVGDLLTDYHHCIIQGDMDRLARVQSELEAADGWRLQQRVETVISQLQLPGEAKMSTLSGGWRRRVALGRALVSEPDILLLDEPTNHLDIPAITWLEKQLRDYRGAVVFVTHDRAFLQAVANSIAEIDRGHIRAWEGDYQGFLRFREQELASEERANALFDKRLAEEERWIRQGIKARRTRNEGRVRALESLREERSQRRERSGRADFSVDTADRSGKRVAELHSVSKSFEGKPVISDFSTLVSRGDRIGIVGANGAGKSTLLKILLGEMEPDSGSVELGTKLEVAYFDQLRAHLNPEQNLVDNVCGGRDFIEVQGKRRHAISYLGDFLFSPERVRTPVKALSGGEQNRAILAKLFSQPANLLVLDEPTNDLDIETLELLEEILLDFKGTILLVSHDRDFMDRVVTSLLIVKGDGSIEESVGSYSDWIARGGHLPDLLSDGSESSRQSASAGQQDKPPGTDAVTATTGTKAPVQKKRSYKIQRELDALPLRIEELENRIGELENAIADPDFYQRDKERTDSVIKEHAAAQAELEQVFERWEELENS
jgi:ATP-binding cassette subfamily F protein uup